MRRCGLVKLGTNIVLGKLTWLLPNQDQPSPLRGPREYIIPKHLLNMRNMFATWRVCGVLPVLLQYSSKQIDGALAAFTGGWLLVSYIRYLMGDDDALTLRGFEGLAFTCVIAVHLIMTALFAPKAPPAAIIFAVLPLAVAAFILVGGITFHRLPRFLRPIAAGVATAVPAAIAIAIAAALFQG